MNWGTAGTVGKVVATLLPAGVVAAVAGKGTLATILLVLGALGGAVGVVGEARSKTLERADLDRAERGEQTRVAATRERAIASALMVRVCAVAEVDARHIGVDEVDPRILERALRVTGDQLAYVDRPVD